MIEMNGIRVRTGCRLHFALIDMNGELGRVDGGMGVGLDSPGWDITVRRSGKGDRTASALLGEAVGAFRRALPVKGAYRIDAASQLPAHVGLGSRTQATMAVGSAIGRLEGMTIPPLGIATLAGRGGTSGIGVNAFVSGGLIVDVGHRFDEKGGFLPSRYSDVPPPPVAFRSELPEDWRFVVAIPDAGIGAHGPDEMEVFRTSCPVPAQDVERISRLILMQAVPAVLEDDIESFGAAIDGLQELGFKAVENRLRGADGKALRGFMRQNGALGCGLSSFGPATYGIVRGDAAAELLVRELNGMFREKGMNATVFSSKASCNGALIEDI